MVIVEGIVAGSIFTLDGFTNYELIPNERLMGEIKVQFNKNPYDADRIQAYNFMIMAAQLPEIRT